MNLEELEERDSDEEGVEVDVLEQNEFPYMTGRLKPTAIPWEEIVAKGKPWKDPNFPHGKYCLFMNHNNPANANKDSKKKWSLPYDEGGFRWKRAGEHYKKGFKLFDGVDPDDIVMGSCNNCYMFAALAGIAEAHHTELHVDEDEKGKRIKDNFLTKEINSAGCYAIQFIIDGEPREIVVDDYFPFMRTKGGKEIFAFAKPKAGEAEIWVQLIEKAWAKLCGSYEASEMGICGEFF